MGIRGVQLELPLARALDPATSHAAAARALEFKARHIALIYSVLKERGAMTKDEIAAVTGLDAVAVARRGAEMQRNGLVVMGPACRNGCRVWRAL